MEYWENIYASGGNSGAGSRGKLKDWKWSQITESIGDTSNIVDIGCGDMKFIGGHEPINYVGIDISKTIIDVNKLVYPNYIFYNINADQYIPQLRAPVVLCMDLLFHIIDDDIYYKILDNIIKYSSKYIVIYSWDKNPIPLWNLKARYYGSNKYQKFRNFDNDVKRFESRGFELIVKSKVSYNKYGALYIFRKSRY